MHIAVVSLILVAGTLSTAKIQSNRPGGKLLAEMVTVVPPRTGPLLGNNWCTVVATYENCTPLDEKSSPLIESSTVTLPRIRGGVKQATCVEDL